MKPIPSPAGHFLIGNILDIDGSAPQESLARLARIHGPIFRLYLSSPRIFVANHAIANELCDEKRFRKSVTGALEQVRNAAKDGLFTAYPGEHNWEIAHRILMPAFGPLSIRGMYDEMQDIVSQMVVKWARFGGDTPIDASEDFTKLTLDSIALCAMGERFNSFYHDDLHPFVHAMAGMLTESGARTRRPQITRSWYRASNEAYEKNIKLLEDTAASLLKRRRENPVDKKDLLNSMINGRDTKTGEQLSDDAIIRNMITFLIAGHETTSGLLSFLFYELLDHPRTMSTLVEEVDSVLGKDPMTVNHLTKLPYIEACLRETLRLHSPAPAFTLHAIGDQVVGGEYEIKDGEHATILLDPMHRDPEVWGEDADEFKPERMLEENFKKLPRNAWKPFGNGSRACIGRPFAMQEAILAVATILQTFNVTKDSPSYQLQIRTSLTIKPTDFFIRARLRDPDFVHRLGAPGMQNPQDTQRDGQPNKAVNSTEKSNLPPLDILFGSNTGTCEALAQALASEAGQHGFAPEVKPLDAAMKSLRKGSPTVVITASYEGQPPDNALHFCEWLGSAGDKEAADVSYAVFGVGNKEWHATYQKVPTLIDDTLAEKGATRLAERAGVDVGHDNIFDLFDTWQSDTLWPVLSKFSKSEATTSQSGPRELKITLGVNTRSEYLRQDVLPAIVTESRLLTKPGAPRKRNIGIRLPTGVTYRTGDYLAVLPLNPPDVIKRVMKHFKLPWDATIKIDQTNSTSLPTGQELSVHDILSGMLELSQPITNRLAQNLSEAIPEEGPTKELKQRVADGEFNKTSVTLLDLLEEYEDAVFTFGQFLAALPPLHLRQYSISSTPLVDPSQCSLTYSVLDEPSKGSRKGRQFHGVASSYMERLSVGDHLQVAVRPSRNGFHLPKDLTKPVIMACAGTGLAPFYGFVAERALMREGGQNTGPMLLFYGCKSPDTDDMYRDEFDKWEMEGVVSVRRAYSAAADGSNGCKHVQDRLWLDRKDVVDLFVKDAQVYICGAGAVGKGIESAFARIRQETTGCEMEEAEAWVQGFKGNRYWSDVFS